MSAAVTAYVLALADDALVSAQRLGWWISRAPELEEDLALANIGLDQLGQARLLLSLAGELEGRGRTEDDLAYFRDLHEFRNVHLVERPQEDFGVAMARLLLLAAWQRELYAALRASADPTLAAIAAKAVKEVTYHLDHAEHWVLRLGDGTQESHDRMQAAVDAEWPYLAELVDGSWVGAGLVASGVAVDPAELAAPVRRKVVDVLSRATLTVPDAAAAETGGRFGVHTAELGTLLDELQSLARAHPGATW